MASVTIVYSKPSLGIGWALKWGAINLAAKTTPNRIGKINNLFLSMDNKYLNLS